MDGDNGLTLAKLYVNNVAHVIICGNSLVECKKTTRTILQTLVKLLGVNVVTPQYMEASLWISVYFCHWNIIVSVYMGARSN